MRASVCVCGGFKNNVTECFSQASFELSLLVLLLFKCRTTNVLFRLLCGSIVGLRAALPAHRHNRRGWADVTVPVSVIDGFYWALMLRASTEEDCHLGFIWEIFGWAAIFSTVLAGVLHTFYISVWSIFCWKWTSCSPETFKLILIPS